MTIVRAAATLAATMLLAPCAVAGEGNAGLDAMIARHAQANGVPESLVHRVIKRESNYNPRASNRGNIGLMQIRHATARGMGYGGSAHGLLDPNTNLTYAVAYLAGAYRVAGGNQNRAVSYYSSGYYYAAKRRGISTRLAAARPAETVSVGEAQASAAAAPSGSVTLANFLGQP